MHKEDERIKREYHNSDHHGYILVTVKGPEVIVVWKALVMSGSVKSWQMLDVFSLTENTATDANTGHSRTVDTAAE